MKLEIILIQKKIADGEFIIPFTETNILLNSNNKIINNNIEEKFQKLNVQQLKEME